MISNIPGCNEKNFKENYRETKTKLLSHLNVVRGIYTADLESTTYEFDQLINTLD
jgi:hypothetical protein